MDLGAMTTKEYSAFPKAPVIRWLSIISGHSLWKFTPLQWCSRCILQSQPTGPSISLFLSLSLSFSLSLSLSIYIYIYIYMCVFCRLIFVDNILNDLELICIHTVKWFKVLLLIILNIFSYCYLIIIILLNIAYLFALCLMVSVISIWVLSGTLSIK